MSSKDLGGLGCGSQRILHFVGYFPPNETVGLSPILKVRNGPHVGHQPSASPPDPLLFIFLGAGCSPCRQTLSARHDHNSWVQWAGIFGIWKCESSPGNCISQPTVAQRSRLHCLGCPEQVHLKRPHKTSVLHLQPSVSGKVVLRPPTAPLLQAPSFPLLTWGCGCCYYKIQPSSPVEVPWGRGSGLPLW